MAIEDFEALKAQLGQLAEVVNKFKSEAVQLRLIEYILSGNAAPKAAMEDEARPLSRRGRRKTRRSVRVADGAEAPAPKDPTQSPKGALQKRRATGNGARALLNSLIDDGYFDQKRTIGDLVAYADEKLARRHKASEFSGALARHTRNKVLDRAKNADGQYEYIRK